MFSLNMVDYLMSFLLLSSGNDLRHSGVMLSEAAQGASDPLKVIGWGGGWVADKIIATA